MSSIRCLSAVAGLVVSVALVSGCKTASIKTQSVSKELAVHAASAQPIGYTRTTKDLKGKIRDAELVSVEGELYQYKTSDGYEWTNYTNPMLPSPTYSGDDWGKGTQKMTKVKGAMFPLVVGNKMSYTVSGKSSKNPNGWSESRKCEVKSQERVQVEAGEFDTFKVVCNSEWRKRTFYFSPELNDIVLYRDTHKTDSQRNRGWEVVAVTSPAS